MKKETNIICDKCGENQKQEEKQNVTCQCGGSFPSEELPTLEINVLDGIIGQDVGPGQSKDKK